MKKVIYILVVGMLFLGSFVVSGVTVDNYDTSVTEKGSTEYIPCIGRFNIYITDPQRYDVELDDKHEDIWLDQPYGGWSDTIKVKTVRWFENLLGVRVLPRAAYPRPSWFDKTSPYRKFLTEIIEEDKAIIWSILNKENTCKLFYDLFNNKNNLGLLLAHIIDLELTLRIFLSINPPEKITFYSKILDKEINTKIKLDLSDVCHKIKYKK